MSALDPQPTVFGTGRIDPLVAPDGSTEYSRALLYLQNRAKRMAKRGQLIAALTGDPVLAYNQRANYQPLVDAANDAMIVADDTDDDHPSIGNQDLNL